MAIETVETETTTIVFTDKRREKDARRTWIGRRTRIFTEARGFNHALLGYSAEPVLAVLYGESNDMTEFVQLMLANGPNRICIISKDEGWLARWRRESENTSQFIFIEAETVDAYPGSVRESVAAAWEQYRYPVGAIPPLLKQGKLLYIPENMEPYIPDDLGYTLDSIVSQERFDALLTDPSIRTWDFDSHKYTPDELVAVAFIIFSKILDLPGLEDVHCGADKIVGFLMVIRQGYKHHVFYHTFVHAMDVVQGTLLFLISLGIIKVVFNEDSQESVAANPRALDVPASTADTTMGAKRSWSLVLIEDNDSKFSSKDVILAFVGALGHDIMHPGLVNSLFIHTVPGYSEKWGTLERYHAKFYIHIVSRLWPELLHCGEYDHFVAEAIWSTEMAGHFKFMTATNREPQSRQHLQCCILKASDICNSIRTDYKCVEQSAIDVWTEFRAVNAISVALGLGGVGFGQLGSEVPANRSFVVSQIEFVTKMFLPFFAWLARNNSSWAEYERRGYGTLDRWQSLLDRLDDTGSIGIAIADPLIA